MSYWEESLRNLLFNADTGTYIVEIWDRENKPEKFRAKVKIGKEIVSYHSKKTSLSEEDEDVKKRVYGKLMLLVVSKLLENERS